MRPSPASRFGLPPVRSAGGALAIALVVGSVIYGLLRQVGLAELVLLLPLKVIHSLWVWQVLSFAFIAADPMGVIFGALILFQMGGSLEASWGRQRALAFSVGVTVLAAVATVLLALLFPTLQAHEFAGGYVMSGAVWVAYGLSLGRAQTNFWGIPLTGNMLALVGAGFVLLSAVFGSPVAVIPEILALLFTWAYTRGASPRMAWLRFSSWRLQGKLKSRAHHLKLVSKDRNMPGDSDRFIH